MSENRIDTITELAEVIASQNEEIRSLTMQLEAQQDIITDYELDQEEEEKVTAALADDFMEILDSCDETCDECQIDSFRDLFSRYFGELDE